MNLIDAYGREIDYLRISVIDKCNLKCFYCVPEEGACAAYAEHSMSLDEIEKLVKIASSMGVRKVRLTGGEPLIRPDILELISRVSAVEGISDLSLTTNGIMLNKMASKLVKAGLSRVNISLDSLDPECALPGLVAKEPQRVEQVNAILNNSFGMLGVNSVVIVERFVAK